MFNRFQTYLKEEFKGLPSTREVNDFKDELLGNLMEKAEELKGKEGMTEDEIYNECIKSISGFEQTLKELKGKPELIRQGKKAANMLIYILTYFALVVGVFLAVSFVTNAWGLSWLIILEGAFLLVIVLLISAIIKAYNLKKFALVRALAIPVSTIIVVGVFIALSMIMGIWAKSWIAFLFLPILIIIVDIVIAAFMGKNNIIIPETIAGIMLLSVMLYVSLSFLGILTWHPYWLIILGGVFVSLVVLAIDLKRRIK